MQDAGKTKVVFRAWRDSGAVVAIMPELPADINGFSCATYEHIGQHGSGAYHLIMAHSRPATADESKELKRELSRIGYKVQEVKRETRQMMNKRYDRARAVRMSQAPTSLLPEENGPA